MTNLEEKPKRSKFNLVFHIILISVIMGSILLLIESGRLREDKMRKEYNESMNHFKSRVDSMEQLKDSLVIEELLLGGKIDSLYIKQKEVNKQHEKKIINVMDATAANHAVWLVETISKMGNSKSK